MVANRAERFAKIGAAALCFSVVAAGRAQNPPAAHSKEDELARAEILIDGGKLDQAIALLNTLAEMDPRRVGVEAKLGKAYYSKRDYPQAITHLKLALKEKPSDGESTQLLGLAYYLSGHLQEAIPLLEKVQSVLPRPDVTASYILGVSFMQLYQLDKSRAAEALGLERSHLYRKMKSLGIAPGG